MSGSDRGGEMSNEQLFQQVALLRWLLSQSDEDRTSLAAMTGVQVARELLDRLTGQSRLDAYKRECILSIAEFVRQNPRASQTEISSQVQKHVLIFAARVQTLESTPIF
ncbi:uncharacterized protein LOC144539591 [Centroberyx gerrardi]